MVSQNDYRGKTYAVTGSTGFIGSRLVDRLVENGAQVVCLVRDVERAKRNASPSGQVTFATLDIHDPAGLRAALSQAEALVHCAYDWNDEAWNATALDSLIAAVQTDRHTKLVHVSSFVVYDLPTSGRVSEETPPTREPAGYCQVKHQLERKVIDAAERGSISAVIIQPTIVYGPRARTWTDEPAMMLSYGSLVLPSDAEGLCNAVYVDDVVDALMLAIAGEPARGERFLISGETPVTWKRFYEGMAAAVGAAGPVYEPSDTIAARNGRKSKLIRELMDPGLLLRRVLRNKIGRTILSLVPSSVRKTVTSWLDTPLERRRGHRHDPSLSHLASLRATYVIACDHARTRLGYRPRYTFEQGMVPTAAYLKRTFG